MNSKMSGCPRRRQKGAAGRIGPEGWKGKGCARMVENINQVHQLSALREGGPALGAHVFPKGFRNSRAERSPRGGCRSLWDGTLWANLELRKPGSQQGPRRQAEVGGKAVAHRSGRAHAKSCVSSGLAQHTCDGLNLLCTSSWEP